MEQDKAVTWATEADRKADLKRRKRAEIKFALFMFAHKVFWSTLHFTRLAGTYSRLACRLNFYRKFPDGRCQWCGKLHG